MKKVLFIAAVAAIALVSCAKTENLMKTNEPGTPVSFGVYTARPATKAVSTTTYGQINTNELLQASAGFGVFGFYSDGSSNAYNGPAASTNFSPNFMYNQLVSYSGSAWSYTPLKYWPNEFNTSDAIGADVDKLTFFAYAPYVASADASTATEGIMGFSANTATGDPTVTFKVPASKDNQIDLLWSDAETKNLTKYAVNGRVAFTFKHALSNLTILPVAIVDATSFPASSGTDVAAGTSVKVNSITVSGQFNQEGTLNLATGVWTSSAASSAQTVSYSPTTAKEVTAINDKAEADAAYAAAPTEFPEFMFIPSSTATEDYVITIDYDFITNDSAVNGGTVTVHNVIHKTLENVEFEQGKKMKLYIGLGMTTVLFNASVADWTADDPVDIWLPVNIAS